jgi:hypothetical protein
MTHVEQETIESAAHKLFAAQAVHPVFPTASVEQIMECLDRGGDDRKNLELFLVERDKLVRNEQEDPYRHGVYLDDWKEADQVLSEYDELLISGGNRGSKTEYGGRKVNEVMISGSKKNVLCLSEHSRTSLQIQQPRVWKYFPKEYKVSKKTKSTFISYGQKNGFSDGTYILPNGSQCWFFNYTQDLKIMEGQEYDFIWCDERVPLSWVETLRFRLISRKGKMLLTFTPVDGVNNTYRDYVTTGTVEEWREAKWFKDKQVPALDFAPRPGVTPYKMQCARPSSKALFWFTEKNPYTNFERALKAVEGAPKSQVLIRLYGWASEMSGRAFPKFSPTMHVVKKDEVPSMGTNYFSCDPAPSRNWFMLWGRVVQSGEIYIYRESPDARVFGDWAEPGEKPDGKMGPAQKTGAGLGVASIRQEVRDVEESNGEKIFERVIDPRAGGSALITREGGQTLIDLLNEPDSRHEGWDIIPAPGVPLQQRIGIINDLLDFNNDPSKPLKRPKLFISEECENLIFALTEWTGLDGEKGATKDPVDALGYLLSRAPVFVNHTTFKPTQVRGY